MQLSISIFKNENEALREENFRLHSQLEKATEDALRASEAMGHWMRMFYMIQKEIVLLQRLAQVRPWSTMPQGHPLETVVRVACNIEIWSSICQLSNCVGFTTPN